MFWGILDEQSNKIYIASFTSIIINIGGSSSGLMRLKNFQIKNMILLFY